VAGPGAGQNLLDFDPFVQFYHPFVLNAVDPSRMLLGTQTLYESFDRGDSLTNLNFSNGQFVGASPSPFGSFQNDAGVPLVYGGRLGGVANPDVIWAGVGDQIVYRERLGDPLQAVKGYHGGMVETIVADPQDYRHVFVCDDSNQVWSSSDAGHSFRNLTANLPQLGGIVLTVEVARTGPQPTDLTLVAGCLNGAYARDATGGGSHAWRRLGDDLPNAMALDLHYYPAQGLLLAGTLGRGVWTLTDPFGQEEAPARSVTAPAGGTDGPARGPSASQQPRLAAAGNAYPLGDAPQARSQGVDVVPAFDVATAQVIHRLAEAEGRLERSLGITIRLDVAAFVSEATGHPAEFGFQDVTGQALAPNPDVEQRCAPEDSRTPADLDADPDRDALAVIDGQERLASPGLRAASANSAGLSSRSRS
jgi:hypothetical protein